MSDFKNQRKYISREDTTITQSIKEELINKIEHYGTIVLLLGIILTVLFLK